MTDIVDEQIETPEWDSGPFCRHWSDPSDCGELCECGHQCYQHSILDEACRECDCKNFTDAKE